MKSLDKEIVEMLVAAGALTQIRDKDGLSAIDAAVAAESEDLAVFLTERTVSVAGWSRLLAPLGTTGFRRSLRSLGAYAKYKAKRVLFGTPTAAAAEDDDGAGAGAGAGAEHSQDL